jgi:hypothetical protein
MTTSEEDTVRLTIFLPKEADLLLRTHLARVGMCKGAISKFFADTAIPRPGNPFISVLKQRKRTTSMCHLRRLRTRSEQALLEARKERFAKHA